MLPFVVTIAGNVGSGKSTVIRYAASQPGWQGILEEQEEFLRHAFEVAPSKFHSQVLFAARRIEQYDEIKKSNIILIERSIDEDKHVFWNYYFQDGKLTEADLQSLYYIYTVIKRKIVEPELTIFLKSPVNILRERIRERGRLFEADLDLEELDKLEQDFLNDEIMKDAAKIVIIDSNRNPQVVWADVRRTILERATAGGK